jgi:hypothetical protein
MKTLIKGIGVLVSGVVLVAYQNCSRSQAFTELPDTEMSSSVVSPCAENEVKSGGVCIPYECKSFVEITSFPTHVPQRTSEGICYYAKIFDQVASGPSSGAQMSNVLSRIHGSGVIEDALSLRNVAAPYILGTFTNLFTLDGERTVKLSGSGSALSSLRVDNYVLAGSRLAASSREISNYRAWGTADSAIGTTGNIKVNDKDVPLASFGAGGTATIGTLTLTNGFLVGEQYEININALDCGGSKALSDVYLVFQ